MTRSGLLAGLALAAAFVAGIGAAAVLNKKPRRLGGVTVAMTMNPTALFLRRGDVLEALSLNAAQRRQADSVLGAGQRRAEALMERMRDDVQNLTDSTRAAVRALLDAGQQARFDSLLARPR